MARVILSLVVVIAFIGGAGAQPDFFAGKQISLLIGTTAGGGYDAYGRLVARHIGRHIPGNPAVIARNMPGGGGLTAANHLYNRAPKDGTEIMIVTNGVPFERLFHTLSPNGKNALFESPKFGWIGSATQTVFVTVTWHKSGIRTIADATKREVVLGASAPNADSFVLAMLSNNLLGTRFKVVLGYPGANEVSMAVENGEIEGEAGKDWTTLTATRPLWLRDNLINILVQMGMRAHPALKGVPMAIDLARSAEDRQVMEVVFAKFGMARPFFTAPGVPADRLAILRRAFDATLADPAVIAEAAKLGMEVSPVRGEEVEALVTRMMATPDALAARAREVLRPRS